MRLGDDHVFLCNCGEEIGEDSTFCFGGKIYHLCKKCLKEVSSTDSTDDTTDAPNRLEGSQNDLLKNLEKTVSLATKEELIDESLLECLEPGDHIMWRRPYVMCHHAIVAQSVDTTTKFKVIHWSQTKRPNMSMKYQKKEETDKTTSTIEIHEKKIDFKKERGKMYRINYDEDIYQKNPPTLVIKRAKILRGLTDYHLFRKNCENFARFCKTGINFNLQFPWLKRKLDQTALSTLFKAMTAIIFADLVQFSWELKHQLMGAFVIIFLELVSLITDLSNSYFEYKYPTSYYRLAKDYQEAVAMRVCEFIFGAAGMAAGFIFFEKLCIWIGDSYCPGMGTWVGFALGTLVFGVAGGFILGVLGKAIGNAIGIRIRPYFKCLFDSKTTESETDAPTLKAADAMKNKMMSRYLSRSWKAQVGMTLVIFSCILFLAFTRQYIKAYHVFRDSKKATCVTINTTYLRTEHITYPCPVIQVRVLDIHPDTWSTLNQSESSNNTKTLAITQLFEKERTFHQGTCSYQPRCLENDTKTGIEIDNHLAKYGYPGARLKCYYHPENPYMVIRKRSSVLKVVNAFVWPFLIAFIGISLIVYMMLRARRLLKSQTSRRNENCIVTLIAVLGLTSYYYLYKRCRTSLR